MSGKVPICCAILQERFEDGGGGNLRLSLSLPVRPRNESWFCESSPLTADHPDVLPVRAVVLPHP